MHISIENVEECCGCSACYSICSNKAITMQEDSLGFKYPKVNANICVECGLCIKVCPIKNTPQKYDLNQKVYAARFKSRGNLFNSQSGGAASALVEKFILDGGVVYGVAYANNFHVVHKRACTLLEADEFKGSKYVQSDLKDCFSEILKDLKSGAKVLFIGTGCQVAGLRNFIPLKFSQQLYCADIICHCAPSPKIWEDYIRYLEDKYHQKIIKAKFRDKKFGWHSCNESFQFSNSVKTSHFLNSLWAITARPSCTKCIATSTGRFGDITFADFWGFDKICDEWNDNKGISLVITNNETGLALFESSSSSLDTIKSSLDVALQPQLQYPITSEPLQKMFISDYEKFGFKYVAYKYGNIGIRAYIKQYLYNVKVWIHSLTVK